MMGLLRSLAQLFAKDKHPIGEVPACEAQLANGAPGPTADGDDLSSAPAETPPALAAPDLSAAANTFCILAWKHLNILPDGQVAVCCKFQSTLTDENNEPLSVAKNSLEEIWNSAEMRSIRRDMLQGKKISACAYCYQQEAAGGMSDRTVYNRNWDNGWNNEDGTTREQLAARSAARDYHEPPPQYLMVDPGNLCNLKCRMCNGGASSRIARDPVHNEWARTWNGGATDPHGPEKRWSEDEAVINELLGHPDQLRQLYLLGGEPMLIKEIGIMLRRLIDTGVAPQVELQMSTNATTTRSVWLPLTEQFKSTTMALSIDGVGSVYEYIRYPAHWDNITKNIAVFRELPKVVLTAGICVQCYNVLRVVDLFRYLDAQGVSFDAYLMDSPRHLSVRTLPPAARRLAVHRLREYVEGDCRPELKERVGSLVTSIESYGDDFDPALLHEFMVYTNDLDVTRGQNFRTALPELFQLIEDAGVTWTGETRHAPRQSLAVLTN